MPPRENREEGNRLEMELARKVMLLPMATLRTSKKVSPGVSSCLAICEVVSYHATLH